ncbi:hypothetical protein BH11PSE1_BH11PSE1_30150 [soil metagenome]
MSKLQGRRGVSRRVRAAAILASCGVLAGCASARLDHAMALVGDPAGPQGFEAVRRDPLNARAHMWTAQGLLEQPGATAGDIELAKSGFRTAARLAPDLWEPLVGLAAAHYRLGEFDEALGDLATAADRRGKVGDLALPLALAAYRAQRPELARQAYAVAVSAGQRSPFLDRAFSGEVHWRPAPVAPPSAPAVLADSDQNIVIEAYIIRDARTAALGSGISLLDSLSINFGGSLVNYSYGEAGSNTTGNVAVTLSGVTYSLNLATRDVGRVSLEASPLVLARLGKTSKFLEGGSVLIVPHGDDQHPIERDVGISISVTPDAIGRDHADLTVVLEYSKISAQSEADSGRGASLLNTEKTHIEVPVRVPYDKTVLIGSLGALTRSTQARRSVVAVPLPGTSAQAAASTVRNVLALISVRRPDEAGAPPLDDTALALRLFGGPLASAGVYGERPSDTPDPGLDALITRIGRPS